MKTYNERRAVAARLREEADYPGHAVQYMEQFISDLRQVLFGDLNPTADYSEIFARLADLIEPSCDRGALVALAEEMVEAFRLGAFTGEGLDAKWCRELHDKYARRIREACGEGER